MAASVQFPVQAGVKEVQNVPDSVYLFSYATTANGKTGRLRLAYSSDRQNWSGIGPNYDFLKSDFGQWGVYKTMFSPKLVQNKANGNWRCVWALTPTGKELAVADSPDLMEWKPQVYIYSTDKGKYDVAQTEPTSPGEITLGGETYKGWIQKVPYHTVEKLIQFVGYKAYRQQLFDEKMADDGVRFAGLKPVEATIRIDGSKPKQISDKLIGIFFEDISHAADGGLYAELVQNRDFEYTQEEQGRQKGWGPTFAWSLQGENAVMDVDTVKPIHPNNPHYIRLSVQKPGAALHNSGWDGIAVKKGAKYDFSFFSKKLSGKGGKVKVALVTKDGNVLAQATLPVSTADWKKRTAVLTSTADAAEASLSLTPQEAGEYAFDMVSLFPQDTYKKQKNGLRADLVQTLADLHPRFVRFPGGCVAHGDGIDNIYDWKGSIGPLEARKPLLNLWGYHQTRGLGYFEYFRLCEDLGAEPLPVLAAGVPCQNSGARTRYGHDVLTHNGQQCGIPMEDMPAYIQDILDLIEYANGDAKKTVWGKKRAEAGHPKPFNLKYIGIGNEDLISQVFVERFTMIFNAIKEKHPEITVIGTVGPFFEGADYEEGWAVASKLGVPMVDEHYYVSPGWFIHNQNYYDHYDRSKPKVYLGEYAAHAARRASSLEAALAEAIYLTGVERNGDVVSMTSYAPLLAKEKNVNWSPDLIYFNNTEVKPTISYHVQKLYGQNSGTEYLASDIKLNNNQDAVKIRVASSVVRDAKSGDLIVKLVNVLPVSVKAKLVLPSLDGMDSQATCTVLSGKPSDTRATPVTQKMTIAQQDCHYEMPAYSMTVIRIPAQAKKK